MIKAFVFIAILFFIILQLYCVNYLDIITHMQGEHHHSNLGSSLTTLDINHDSYQDLIVGSRAWNSLYPNPYNVQEGKVYFYYGGAGFDSIPDFILTGQYAQQYSSVKNIGDVNGDGFDDLYISGEEPDTAPDSIKYIRIWTGGTNPSVEPNISIPYHWELNHDLMLVDKLGDFNGDGYDDIGVIIENPNSSGNFYIVWGGTYNWQYLFTSCPDIIAWDRGFNGIGDINDDGYDDFTIGYTDQNVDPEVYQETLYFGNAAGSTSNNAILYQHTSGIDPASFPLGDVNGDGIADFMGYTGAVGLAVWLSPYSNQTIPDTGLNPAWHGGYSGRALSYGDLNNDGFDDVAGSSYFQQACSIWLGRSNFNGTSDLIVYASSTLNPDIDHFGKELTMGDYNADGYSDVAVSAPMTDFSLADDYRGYVYVYAGNSELEDTTVANEDETVPVNETSLWDINVYPNPVKNKTGIINIELTGSGYKTAKNLMVEIYNSKGQKVISKTITKNEIKFGKLQAKLRSYTSGIYLVSVIDNSQNKITKKITIK